MNTLSYPVKTEKSLQETILRGPDGVYRWVYELNLFTNPTILFVLWKIFFWIVAGIWVLSVLLSLGNRDYWWEGFRKDAWIHLLILAGFTVLCALGYFIYALIMGGKYCVLFEMDEKGVRHTQLPKQVKKAEALGMLTMLAGVAGGSLSAVAIGMNSTARTSVYSEFSKVRSVKAYRWRKVIKVNEPFNKNQVYIGGSDFEFVRRFIAERCPKAKIRG